MSIRTIVLISLLAHSVPATSADRPNVIILLADDLGSKDIGCDGGPVRTPALDALAANGVRFTDFHSGAPVCSPSRATLLTGRQHLRTGVYTVIQDHAHQMHLLEREVTIAEILKASGYQTVHLGKWHVGTPFRGRDKPSLEHHGFDYWFATDNNASPSHRSPINFVRNGKAVGETEGFACQIVADEAITWLSDHRDPSAPFFLNIWFQEPHAPIAAPDDIVTRYGDLEDPAAIYSGTIDNTDRAIARLVAKLKDMGEDGNTLIFYSSDHGSYRPDRNGGLRGNKGSNFEGGLRTPGIFCWPDGIPGGRVEDTPGGSVDLLPTICGLLGIQKPANVHLDGADLSPILTARGKFVRQQPLFWHSPTGQPNVALRDGNYTLMGYRAHEFPKDHKRINELLDQIKAAVEKELGHEIERSDLISRSYNSEFESQEANRLRGEFVRLNMFQESWIPAIKSGSGGFRKFELYDLSTDPAQGKDLAKEKPDVVDRLKKRLLAINQSVLADAPEWGVTGYEPEPVNAQAPPGPADLEKLLAIIDRHDLPKGYTGQEHQDYVDKRIAELNPRQRGRLGHLWKQKQRLEPDMENRGRSFVKILEFVASGDK